MTTGLDKKGQKGRQPGYLGCYLAQTRQARLSHCPQEAFVLSSQLLSLTTLSLNSCALDLSSPGSLPNQARSPPQTLMVAGTHLTASLGPTGFSFGRLDSGSSVLVYMPVLQGQGLGLLTQKLTPCTKHGTGHRISTKPTKRRLRNGRLTGTSVIRQKQKGDEVRCVANSEWGRGSGFQRRAGEGSV